MNMRPIWGEIVELLLVACYASRMGRRGDLLDGTFRLSEACWPELNGKSGAETHETAGNKLRIRR
jgi:hypothetical protein